jgi:hypothetical protein
MSDHHIRNLPVPFFSQREINYRWQQVNTSGQEIGSPVSLAWTTCNMASLCMLLHYYGITNDSPDTVLRKYFNQTGFEENGKIINNTFSQEGYLPNQGPNRLEKWWTLEQFPNLVYNVPKSYIKQRQMNLSGVQEQIARGNPVMFSFGPLVSHDNRDKTENWKRGHIAVIRGFTVNNHIILNDPWGDPTSATGNIRASDSNSILGYYDYSIGRGDNTAITREAFSEITKRSFQVLYIEYPHIWSFPFKQNITQDGNTISRTFRFSDHTVAAEIVQNAIRTNRVNDMSATEVFDNAGYPISSNRFWHDGIHIRGRGAVYAIGPGRIVAARMLDVNRMPTNGSNNFVLVRHKVKIGNQLKDFYSHYMHLAPVDIAQRIREQVTGSHSEREEDWLDQIIKYIRPKCAIVRIAETANGLEGAHIHYMNDNHEIVPTDPAEMLADRALIYFCPTDESIRQRLESINPEEELQDRMPSSFYNDLNNLEKYIEQEIYYKFYYVKKGIGNTVSCEPRYVEVNNNYVIRAINKQEFIYYRRVLAKLIKGDVTVFARENTRIRNQTGTQSAIQLLNDNLKLSFPEEGIFITPVSTVGSIWANTYNARYNDIRNYYIRLINQIKTENDYVFKLARLAQHLSERLFYFCKTLLSFPPELLSNPSERFKLRENWIKKLVTNTDSTYSEILKLIYPSDDELIVYRVNQLERALDYGIKMEASRASKIDYYFEVNGNTKLGDSGRFKNEENIIHFEIFSDDPNLISTSAGNAVDAWVNGWVNHKDCRRFVSVPESMERNDFFNAETIIRNLRSANFLKSPPQSFAYPNTTQITSDEISNFLKNISGQGSNVSLQYAVVKHLHSHARLTSEVWEGIIQNGVGVSSVLLQQRNFENYLSYKWFSEELVDELNPSRNSIFKESSGVFAVFYHPIRFLAWLDEFLCREANNGTT